MSKKLLLLMICLVFTCCLSAFVDCGCTRAYIGVEGGGAWHLGRPHGNKTAGGFFNGTPRHGRIDTSGILGASLGLFFNQCLRADISYSYLNSRYKWTTFFPVDVSIPTRFRSTLHSNIVLANLYVHFDSLLGGCFSCLEPYFAAGIGFAHNNLSSIKEFSSVSGSLTAKLRSRAHTNFAARLGLGVMSRFCGCFALDLAFFANYIGKISTGNSRIFPAGGFQVIGPHSFTRNWIGTMTIGLKYFF